MEKRIELVKRKVKDLRLDFGNPRKIKSKKKKDLAASLETYGDFDIIVINEQNQVIGGNQRVTILKEKDPEIVVDCKMLIGYTDQEQNTSTSNLTLTLANGYLMNWLTGPLTFLLTLG